jgi:tetratricopeptide (TPR) repeat protein
LVGISRQYDDLDCQRIQGRHGVRIPGAATIIEVNGLRLPIANPSGLAAAPAPILLLPRGTHAVRFRPSELPLEIAIDDDFVAQYGTMRTFFSVGGSIRGDELTSRGARAMDVHGAPFLLNFMGAADATQGRWAVAERKFRRALVVNPTFGPAHLNLAECLFRRNEMAEAARECALAEAFNVHDVFGLAAAITRFRRKLGEPIGRPTTADVRVESYVSTEPISEDDHRLTALLEGVSKYAIRDEERGKILNNLAVHFADTDRPQLALHHFRGALAVVKVAGPERFELAAQIFSNMSRVCRRAGFEEAAEYERMRHLVSP